MEREEVKDMITAETSGPLARIEAAVDLVALNVSYIEDHMKVANGNTAKNIEKIETIRLQVEKLERNLPHNTINCPQNEILQDIKIFVDEAKTKKRLVKDFGDNYLRDKSEKRADFIKFTTAIGIIITALALLINLTFSVVGYNQRKELKKEVDRIEKSDSLRINK